MSSELSELPAAYVRLAPELRAFRFPREVLATCASCAMRRSGPGHIVFTARANCCTYQPVLANYLVGRVLRRGDLGTERMQQRLTDLRGVDVRGVRAVPELAARYEADGGRGFGRDDTLTCPYWVEGSLGCSIHRDRNAVCRTWFCKTTRGGRGDQAWRALKDLLRCLEHTFVEQCLEDGEPPQGDVDLDGWTRWFHWCAEHIDNLEDRQIEALRGPRLAQLIDAVRGRIAARDADMPDVVAPRVTSWKKHDHGIAMIGWASTDPVEVPPWIFELLSRFDGARPWWEARAQAEEALGVPVSDDLVFMLWRRGLLDAPVDDGERPVNP